jgi:quercetin dioxygenase-like cupin family protein
MTRLQERGEEVAQLEVEDQVFLRQRFRFHMGDGVLHVETWVEPGGGVTPHVHPAMEERFEVLAGRPSFLAGREWRTAAPGDIVVVPAGVRHSYRNRGSETAHFVCHVRPPSSLQEFLTEVAALGRSGKLTRHGLPKTPGTMLRAAALAQRHREMAVLLFPPMPPPFLQRLLFPLLARLAGDRANDDEASVSARPS